MEWRTSAFCGGGVSGVEEEGPGSLEPNGTGLGHRPTSSLALNTKLGLLTRVAMGFFPFRSRVDFKEAGFFGLGRVPRKPMAFLTMGRNPVTFGLPSTNPPSTFARPVRQRPISCCILCSVILILSSSRLTPTWVLRAAGGSVSVAVPDYFTWHCASEFITVRPLDLWIVH